MMKTLNILVVDDNQGIREAVADALEAFGHEVGKAEGAVEALAMLASKDFDLVVTDWRMPSGMDGMELANQIQLRLHSGPAVPVILMTGNELTPIQRQVARKAGVTGFLKKPVGLPELKAAIETVIRGKGEPQQSHPFQPDPAVRSTLRKIDYV